MYVRIASTNSKSSFHLFLKISKPNRNKHSPYLGTVNETVLPKEPALSGIDELTLTLVCVELGALLRTL